MDSTKSPDPVSVPGDDRGNGDLARVLKIAASIAAPTTVLTGLLYFFGWSHAYWFFDYFGVNSTVLGLSTEDYLMRSVDGLFVPMAVVASLALVVVWTRRLIGPVLARRLGRWRVPVTVGLTAGFGLLLTVVGVLNVFGVDVLTFHLTVPPLSLAVGVVLLMYASRLHSEPKRAGDRRRYTFPRWMGLTEWAAVFVLVSLGLFWAVHDYSAAVGTSRAQAAAAQLGGHPDVVLYSEQSLSLDGPGVRESRCSDPEAAYPVRYDGLKLILRAGEQFLFLPGQWSRASGAAIVIPRSDSLRLEFLPATGAARDATC